MKISWKVSFLLFVGFTFQLLASHEKFLFALNPSDRRGRRERHEGSPADAPAALAEVRAALRGGGTARTRRGTPAPERGTARCRSRPPLSRRLSAPLGPLPAALSQRRDPPGRREAESFPPPSRSRHAPAALPAGCYARRRRRAPSALPAPTHRHGPAVPRLTVRAPPAAGSGCRAGSGGSSRWRSSGRGGAPPAVPHPLPAPQVPAPRPPPRHPSPPRTCHWPPPLALAPAPPPPPRSPSAPLSFARRSAAAIFVEGWEGPRGGSWLCRTLRLRGEPLLDGGAGPERGRGQRTRRGGAKWLWGGAVGQRWGVGLAPGHGLGSWAWIPPRSGVCAQTHRFQRPVCEGKRDIAHFLQLLLQGGSVFSQHLQCPADVLNANLWLSFA